MNVASTGTTATLPFVIQPSTGAQASGAPALGSARLVDTRSGAGAGPIGDRKVLELQVAGQGGVPDSAVAVALNVTVVDAVNDGYLRCGRAGWPCPRRRT